jgi:hypothetical protein
MNVFVFVAAQERLEIIHANEQDIGLRLTGRGNLVRKPRPAKDDRAQNNPVLEVHADILPEWTVTASLGILDCAVGESASK